MPIPNDEDFERLAAELGSIEVRLVVLEREAEMLDNQLAYLQGERKALRRTVLEAVGEKVDVFNR